MTTTATITTITAIMNESHNRSFEFGGIFGPWRVMLLHDRFFGIFGSSGDSPSRGLPFSGAKCQDFKTSYCRFQPRTLHLALNFGTPEVHPTGVRHPMVRFSARLSSHKFFPEPLPKSINPKVLSLS